MELAQRIRTARKEAGLTQKVLAAKVGCSEKSVNLWETTERVPDLTFLLGIARATGKDVAYFTEEVAA
jgi:transcriptional regulator with XRE-family HTH domain